MNSKTQNAGNHRMGRKKTKQEREAMFRAWCEKSTVNYVANKCGVHSGTVRRYRREDNWDARAEIVSQKTQAKTAESVADANAGYIQTAEEAIEVFAAGLVGEQVVNCPHCSKVVTVQVPKTKISAQDFANLVLLVKGLRREQQGENAQRRLIIEHVYPDGYQRED